jgi:carbon-monoxide dehydrogenase medium subunit
VKSAPLEYVRATDAAHAVALLAEHGPDARILAGGQSLVQLLNFRHARPSVLVDINRTTDLDYVRLEGDTLVIGAMTRLRTLENSAEVAAAVPLLTKALGFVGHVANRNRGTIGGSLAFADPAGEVPAVATALGADMVVTGPDGTRTISAADFFTGEYTTALAPGELLTAVRLPVLAPGSGVAVEELSLRHNELAVVAAMAAVTLDGEGRVAGAWLSVAGANPVPVRLSESESILTGQAPSSEVIAAAGAAVGAVVQPVGNRHAPAEYRRQMAQLFVTRAITKAITDAVTRTQERAA